MSDWQVANLVVRQRPDLADESIGEPMDGTTLLFGYARPDGAFIREPGAPQDLFENPSAPSGRPGTRVPHLRLPGDDGGHVSPRDLIGPHFLVLTGASEAEALAEATSTELGVALRCRRLCTVDRTCARALGVTATGTVLVRPDGVVAWRGENAGDLDKALRTVLRR